MKNLLSLLMLLCSVHFTATSQGIKAISTNLFTYLPGTNNQRTLMDGIAVLFNGQSNNVDLSDAKKMSNPLENIAIVRNKVLLAAEQRTSYDTIPITMWNLQNRDYELEIFTKNIDTLFLEDVKTHARKYITTAKDTIRYRFTSQIKNSIKDSAIAFWLIFDTSAAPVKPPVHNDCDDEDEDHDKDRDKDKEKDNEKVKLKLYPNPVSGRYINLDMKNLKAGKCRVTIFAETYTSSYSFMHGDKCTEKINLSHLPRGKYYFIIEDQQGWKETRQVLVY